MISHMSVLRIESIQRTGTYRLTESLLLVINGQNFHIPKGFVTDFATIPRYLWAFIASDDKGILEASVLHDYLYKSPGLAVSRKSADRLLLDGMNYLDEFATVTKYAVYYAVRLFGWLWWVK